MARPKKAAHLLIMKDRGKRAWIIRDGGRSFRTGYYEEDLDQAQKQLDAYLIGSWRPRSASVSYVYYVSASHSTEYPIKIGFCSFSTSVRIAQLQNGNPNILVALATEAGSPDLEKKRHAQFRHLHIRGEWFRRADELMKHIDSLSQTKIYV